MPAARINFNNLNDGVDWANELPPHIAEQMQEERRRQQRHDMEARRMASQPMFAPWPISEDTFPIPPSVSRRRAARALVPARGGRVSAGATFPQMSHPAQRQGHSAIDELFSAQLRAMEEMAEDIMTTQMLSTGISAGIAQVAALQQLFATESRAPTTETRAVMVHGVSSGPQMTIMHVEEHRRGGADGTHTVRRVQRHINSSGSNFDIITGAFRGPRQIPAANNSEWELPHASYEQLLELDRENEPVGLEQRQIRSMKVQQYRGPSVTCSICLEEVKKGANILDIGCGHTFHHACITRWLTQRNCCPTCRREIPRHRKVR